MIPRRPDPTRRLPARAPLPLSRRGVLGALAAACLASPVLHAAEAARPVRAVEVAPGIHAVLGENALGTPANRNFISNAGFVITSDGVVVIDALGSPALAQELIAEIRTPDAAADPRMSSSRITTPITSTACRRSRRSARPSSRIRRAGCTSTPTPPACGCRRAATSSHPGSTPTPTLVAADRWLDAPVDRSAGRQHRAAHRPRRAGAHARGPGDPGPRKRRAVRRRPGLPQPHPVRRPGRQPQLDRFARPADRPRAEHPGARPWPGVACPARRPCS